MRIRLAIMILFCLASSGMAGCTAATPPPPTLPVFQARPTFTPQASQSPLQVVTYCSPTQLRTGVAKVSWSATQEEAQAQQLQITNLKQGFEKNIFGHLAPLQDKQIQLTGNIREFPATIRGLQRLQVTVFAYDAKQNLVTVQLSDLEPGVLYFLRLQSSGKTVGGIVSVQAPICTADMQGSGD